MRARTSLGLLVTALAACSSSSTPSSQSDASTTDSGAQADLGSAVETGADAITGDAASTTDAAAGTCAAPVATAPSVLLADFESGAIPTSDSATEGFRGSDVARGTIVHPGAHSTATAASFDYASDNAVFFQGNVRPQYLNGSATYRPDLGNAIELWIKAPAGSATLSSSAATLGLWTYHYKRGDPWVGPNASGGNLTDSQMHGYANFSLAPAAADTWTHLVFTTSAFKQSRGNYHFYAARAVVEDQTFFGALRQFEIVALETLPSGSQLSLDELRLITLPPTANVCPPSIAKSVSASAGDVLVPITISNPTSKSRTYHVFLSSEIGVDRQTLEGAMHDQDSVASVDDLQGGVGADGGLGAAELFADDGTGHPKGASLAAAGSPLTIASGAEFKGVLVHHVTPGMLGAATSVTSGSKSYSVQRNTLTTSVIVWDPTEPHAGDAAIVGATSNADSSHPAPPGFPTYVAPPSGWGSADVPVDQVGGYFVSVVTLTP
ncbi:MAG: hypothetical protein ACHREM_18545 [Polyangiales bacterium]